MLHAYSRGLQQLINLVGRAISILVTFAAVWVFSPYAHRATKAKASEAGFIYVNEILRFIAISLCYLLLAKR